MSKGPDLSAFPIPRKGSAKPLGVDKPPRAPKPEPEVVAPVRVVAKRQPDPPVSSGQIVATTLEAR